MGGLGFKAPGGGSFGNSERYGDPLLKLVNSKLQMKDFLMANLLIYLILLFQTNHYANKFCCNAYLKYFISFSWLLSLQGFVIFPFYVYYQNRDIDYIGELQVVHGIVYWSN